MNADHRSSRMRGPWSRVLAVILLCLLAAQALGMGAASSITFDELYQVSAGYAYLRTGDARLNSHHPPLMDVWLALPLLLIRPNLPLESAAWQAAERGTFGDVFVWQANPDLALRMIWLGRLPNVALALLLGAVIFRCMDQLAGRPAALLALTVYVLDPGIVANAGLSTNDLGVTAMVFVATWAWWTWLERGSPLRLVVAGLAMGAACASKYTGLIAGPIAALLALIHRPPRGLSGRAWLRRAGGLGAAGLICGVTIWAAYGFAWAGGLPAPTFWQGIGFQGDRVLHGQPVYALGEIWPNGVWFYYPLAFVLKTPLPTMILVATGLGIAIRRRAGQVLGALALPAAVIAVVTGASALQLGHRYLLPMLPFLFGLAGYAVTAIPRPVAGWRRALPAVGVGAMVAWGVWNAASIYPHHLSFFNELAGGPAHADRYLVDANLDWGQDLPALKAVVEKWDLPFVHLGYFGTAVPGAYGIPYWPAPGFLRFIGGPESMAFNPTTPDPGWYAISRTSLRQGLVLTDPHLYVAFRSLAPVDRAGYSIDLYHVEYPPSTPAVRAVVQGERVGSMPAGQLGWREGHRLIVKWVPDGDSLVLAMNGPACYRVPDPLAFAPDLRDGMVAGAEDCAGGQGIAVDAEQAVGALIARWTAGSSLWSPEGRPVSPPVTFGDRVDLLGYRLAEQPVAPGGTVSLTLLWQVRSEDLRPPVKGFVHLLAPDGVPMAQRDGWGSAISGLEVGDVIVQHVSLPLPGDVEPGPYRLQVGLYSPDTQVRWTAWAAEDMIGDRVWLPEVIVQ